MTALTMIPEKMRERLQAATDLNGMLAICAPIDAPYEAAMMAQNMLKQIIVKETSLHSGLSEALDAQFGTVSQSRRDQDHLLIEVHAALQVANGVKVAGDPLMHIDVTNTRFRDTRPTSLRAEELLAAANEILTALNVANSAAQKFTDERDCNLTRSVTINFCDEIEHWRSVAALLGDDVMQNNSSANQAYDLLQAYLVGLGYQESSY